MVNHLFLWAIYPFSIAITGGSPNIPWSTSAAAAAPFAHEAPNVGSPETSRRDDPKLSHCGGPVFGPGIGDGDPDGLNRIYPGDLGITIGDIWENRLWYLVKYHSILGIYGKIYHFMGILLTIRT